MFSKKVSCGEFVKRQTPESGYSHFEGTWEELADYAGTYLNTGYCKPGYKDGVVLVSFPEKDGFGEPLLSRFRSAIVDLDEESKLTANYAPRRPGETPFIRVSAKGKKQVAKYASVVLYRHDVLEENSERETDAEWEIVAIKARVSQEEEPMDPYTMARNFLHLKGGTKGDFTAEQFAKSIVYWNSHCMTTGKPKWFKKIMNFFRGQ
jgi:Protein of unknown function (DUF3228)